MAARGNDGNVQTGLRGLLGDPALSAMGLVPARGAAATGSFADNPALQSWRAAWAALALVLAVLFAAFRETAGQMVDTWYSSATFNHGFLIVPISAYLIWSKRGALSNRAPRPSLWGVLVILVAGIGWLAGHAASVALVEEVALVLMIQGAFLAILGLEVCRLLAFPLAYLLFAVPFGAFLIPPLQDLTAEFVVAGIRLVGIPVFHDGIFISIPTGNFLVAEACSGVRFLIATVALGFLFAHLTYTSLWRKTAFVALAFAVPIIANGFRAFGIVMIAHLSDNRLAVGVDHIVYGWIFFAIVTVVLLLIGMTFRDAVPPDEAPDVEEMRCAASRAVPPKRIALAAVLSLTAGLASPAYAGMLEARPAPEVRGALPTPQPGGGWRLAGVTREDWSPVFPSARARLLRTYVKDGREVQLFVAYYARQRQGAELVGSGNTIADGKSWSRAASDTVAVTVSGDRLTLRRTRMLGRGRGRIAYHWYWIGGDVTANRYLAKFLQTKHVLLGDGDAGAVIAISSVYEDTPDEADAALKDFAANLGPLETWLGRFTRGG